MIAAPSMCRRLLCLGIAAIAVLALLGHACFAPSPAEGAAVPFADSHHGGPDGAPDASHATLCEGMVIRTGASTASVASQAVVLPASASVVTPLLPPLERPRESFTSRADVSPPLFLLHASFRI